MKAPLSWVREFTAAEGTPAQLAHTLSFLGLVVDGTEVVAAPFPGIVVARVLATKPHPAADRIQLVEVDAGDGEALQVCCGAFNMRAGDLVPLATLGTVMPDGLAIARRKMRGEWSNGMLCSARELGLGPEGNVPGIYILPPGARPGEPLAQELGLAADVVFELDISPNRPDCFSIVGIARDLAAALGQAFSLPAPPHVVDNAVPAADVAVGADATDLCPRFTGTVIAEAGSASVPALVAWRLSLCGMRAINPIVDVSNYVMLELGQPNHPYDLDRLGGGGLRVRRAAPGEQIVTLDGVTRRLGADDCVIADAAGTLMGIAGIMGGQEAEISPGTRTILLEMANFAPPAVAATGKALVLSSEARTRFERGVDIEVADLAIDRFVELLGPGVRRGPTTDVRAGGRARRHVPLRAARANLLLGTSLGTDECAQLLAPLGFEAAPGGDGALDVTVPTWRPDCEREVDLIEEVARMYGYDRIERALPARPMAATALDAYQKGRRRAKEVMVGSGATEAWTASFVSAGDISRAGLAPGGALEMENPLDQSQNLLRTSLLPGLLAALGANRDRQAGGLSLFEVGNVFSRAAGGGPSVLVPGVVEEEQLALVALGESTDATYAVKSWEVLRRGLRVEGGHLEPGSGPVTGLPGGPLALQSFDALHAGRRSWAMVGGERIGAVGELAPAVAGAFGLEGRVAVLVVDMRLLLGASGRAGTAVAPSRFPASDLDVAFMVSEEVPAGHLAATVRRAAGELAEAVGLFDAWQGPSLGPGRRSLAFRARLRAPDRTLTDEDVARVRERVAAAALAEHGAVLRGS